MPIYEYRCAEGHTFEVRQSFSEDALTECIECGAPANRVLHPVAIHFKGSGFYSTDYGRGKKSPSSSDGKAESSAERPAGDAKTESKGTTGEKKAAEA
jgi:putative FmdB family regulatory protein